MALLGSQNQRMATLTYPMALAATLAVEVPVWGALLQVCGVPLRRALVLGVVVNLVSHPIFWFVVYPGLAGRFGEGVALVVGEACVVAAETVLARLLLRRDRAEVSWGLVLGVAVSANVFSIAAGLLLQR